MEGSIYLMQRATEKELLTKFPCGGQVSTILAYSCGIWTYLP